MCSFITNLYNLDYSRVEIAEGRLGRGVADEAAVIFHE
jgi:hypothetical protein